MKPPVTHDALMDMWAEDAVIDETEPARALAKIPILHAKYLRILSHHNLVVKKLHKDYVELRKLRREYYRGQLNNPEDLQTYGWEPFRGTILREDMADTLDADKLLNAILVKKIAHQEIVDCVTAIMKELHSRTFQVRSMIDWEKFVGGQ